MDVGRICVYVCGKQSGGSDKVAFTQKRSVMQWIINVDHSKKCMDCGVKAG